MRYIQRYDTSGWTNRDIGCGVRLVLAGESDLGSIGYPAQPAPRVRTPDERTAGAESSGRQAGPLGVLARSLAA
jgi:hypothetical protein